MEVIAVDRGVKLILDSTDEVKCLYQRVGGSGTKTLHDGANNNFQIPVGRKYIGNYIYVQAPEGGNSEFNLYDSASTDSATGTTLIADGFRLLNSATTVCEFPVFFEVAAGRYINYKEGDAGSSAITLIGVLTNA